MKKDCFIVVHKNHESDDYTCAFFEEADARKVMEEDVETVKKDLDEQGYTHSELRDAFGNAEVYVADSGIYYAWEIFKSTIE